MILALLILAIGLGGCTGGGTGSPDPGSASMAAAPAVETDAPVADPRLAWVDDPGEPGVDYDPRRITVTYKRDAKLPKGMSGLAPVAEESPSNQHLNPRFKAITDAIAASRGLTITNQVYWNDLNVAGFEVPEDADGANVLAAIRSEFADAVELAHYSLLYKQDAAFTPNDPDYTSSSPTSYSNLWSLHKIRSGDAWGISRGKATEWLAVVDTGVRLSHEELTAQVLNPVDVTGTDTYKCNVVNNTNNVTDNDGHGTFIAGQVGAEGNNGQTIIGAAHLCKILPIKITNGGSAFDADIIEGCYNAFQLGARVISLSFGDYHNQPAMETLVDNIWDGGGIFVASAGNDGVTTAHYPSDYDNSISVGATNLNDARASFSNYGAGVDIAAPGTVIKSCSNTGDSDYVPAQQGNGTSFASPLVAAAAALIWSYDSALTNQDIRDILLSTAAPTTGFTEGTVGRLDMGAALSEAAGLRVELPVLDKLIYSGDASLTVEVGGDPERVDCYLGGELADSRTNAPWTFTVDTTSIDYGIAVVQFVAVRGLEQSSRDAYFLVDNSAGLFPLTEGFENGNRDFLPLELKTYDVSLLSAIKSIPGPGANWTATEVAGGGPGAWNDDVGAPFDGLTCMRFGTGAQSYGGYEIDALVSRRIDLTSVNDATMVFHHHYNIEDGGSDYDRGMVYVTTDAGVTYSLAELNGGGDALFSGYQAGWGTVQIDLSAYAGEKIHIVLAFESDPNQAGEQIAEPAGWWVDSLTVAMDYAEDIPTIDGVDVSPGIAVGDIPAVSALSITVNNPDNVARVEFLLDFVSAGATDVTINDDSAPFQAEIDIPAGLPNQHAQLSVSFYNAGEVPGVTQVIPIYVFNLLGDTNADGVVDKLDLPGYATQIGLSSSDAGYIPLYDSDLDGTVTEQDAAAVGYSFGNTL